MTTINKGTKKYEQVLWTWLHADKGTLEQVYTKPSADKRESYDKIFHRAMGTYKYNHDLKVVGASSWSYSTMYSYSTLEGKTYVVYDTKANTFIFEV